MSTLMSPTSPSTRSLKSRAISSSAWVIGGQVSTQAIRLGGNLILTRLLLPDVFGLMAIMQAVLTGIRMFSDIGINGGVIRSKRGDDETFLNTAWTMQVIRGFLLWVIICVVAFPSALFYQEPILTPLLIVIGFTSVTDGFWSTALLTLRRNVNLKPEILRDVIVQAVVLLVMIGLAWATRSVWALVIGAVVRSILLTITSYYLPSLHRPRLVLDRAAVAELLRFGRWILLSTGVSFLFRQGDRMVLGKVVSMDSLGVYGIGAFWATAVLDVVLSLSRQVLFPLYANIASSKPESLRQQIFRARNRLLGLFLPPLCFLVIFGDQLIRLLYTEPYHQAGPILQVLALGSISSVVIATSASVLLALGDSFRYMILQALRGIGLLAGMYFGYQYGEFPGLVIGMMVSHFFAYPVLLWAVWPYRVGLPRQDFAAFGLCVIVCLLGLSLTGFWPQLPALN